ncbi:hypothetical protein DESC_20004 [Desulfosarcina cetonica]|nr:hypothetical protein DESC_20004 [Desulfosarcina cetonica]
MLRFNSQIWQFYFVFYKLSLIFGDFQIQQLNLGTSEIQVNRHTFKTLFTLFQFVGLGVPKPTKRSFRPQKHRFKTVKRPCF